MALEYLILEGNFQDRKVPENFETWKETLNQIVTAYNSGVTKTFNTSAAYSVTVTNGIITAIS